MKKTLFLLSFLIAFSFLFSGEASAGTVILRPSGAGSNTSLSFYDGQWGWADPSRNWQQVDEEVSDENATFNYTGFSD